MIRHLLLSNSRNISSCNATPGLKIHFPLADPFPFLNSTKPILGIRRKNGKMNTMKVLQLLSRVWNGPNSMLVGKQAEQKMISLLRNALPKAEMIEVIDISGGCGAMFEITVVAPEFEGLNTMKQHRLINDVLKEEIKGMHGIRIHTSLPKS